MSWPIWFDDDVLAVHLFLIVVQIVNDIQAGLSLDEIWSYGEESPNAVNQEEAITTEGVPSVEIQEQEAENNSEDNADESVEASADAPVDLGDAAGTAESPTEVSELSTTNGFELLDDADVDVEINPELDELEAEIARELADM